MLAVPVGTMAIFSFAKVKCAKSKLLWISVGLHLHMKSILTYFFTILRLILPRLLVFFLSIPYVGHNKQQILQIVM